MRILRSVSCFGPPVSAALSLMLLLAPLGAAGCYDVDGEPAGPPGTGPGDGAVGVDTGVALDGALDSALSADSGAGGPDTGAPDAGAVDSSAADSGPADTGPAVSCPDVYGAFSMSSVGIGCGDFDVAASQRIDGDRRACAATFSSTGGVNGTATVLASGNLSGASLSFGSGAPRSCSGMWTAGTSTMIVACGTGPSRCSVTLVRAGP